MERKELPKTRKELMACAKERKLKHIHDMNKEQLGRLIHMHDVDPTIMYLPEMRERTYNKFKRSLAKYRDGDIIKIIKHEPNIKKMRKTIQDEATNAKQRRAEMVKRSEKINNEALKGYPDTPPRLQIQSTSTAIENAKKEAEAGLYNNRETPEPNESYWSDITVKNIESGKYDRSTLNQIEAKEKKEYVLDQIKVLKEQAKTLEGKKTLLEQLSIIKDTVINNVKEMEKEVETLNNQDLKYEELRTIRDLTKYPLEDLLEVKEQYNRRQQKEYNIFIQQSEKEALDR